MSDTPPSDPGGSREESEGADEERDPHEGSISNDPPQEPVTVDNAALVGSLRPDYAAMVKAAQPDYAAMIRRLQPDYVAMARRVQPDYAAMVKAAQPDYAAMIKNVTVDYGALIQSVRPDYAAMVEASTVDYGRLADLALHQHLPTLRRMTLGFGALVQAASAGEIDAGAVEATVTRAAAVVEAVKADLHEAVAHPAPEGDYETHPPPDAKGREQVDGASEVSIADCYNALVQCVLVLDDIAAGADAPSDLDVYNAVVATLALLAGLVSMFVALVSVI